MASESYSQEPFLRRKRHCTHGNPDSSTVITRSGLPLAISKRARMGVDLFDQVGRSGKNVEGTQVELDPVIEPISGLLVRRTRTVEYSQGSCVYKPGRLERCERGRFRGLGRLMNPSDCRDYYGCSAGLCPLDDAWPIKASTDCSVCPYMLVACRKPVPRVIVAACRRMARDANLPRQFRAQIKTDFGTARERFTRGTLLRAAARGPKATKREHRAMQT
jgi:hypothetical protein